jgi:hypothetical protein
MWRRRLKDRSGEVEKFIGMIGLVLRDLKTHELTSLPANQLTSFSASQLPHFPTSVFLTLFIFSPMT